MVAWMLFANMAMEEQPLYKGSYFNLNSLLFCQQSDYISQKWFLIPETVSNQALSQSISSQTLAPIICSKIPTLFHPLSLNSSFITAKQPPSLPPHRFPQVRHLHASTFLTDIFFSQILSAFSSLHGQADSELCWSFSAAAMTYISLVYSTVPVVVKRRIPDLASNGPDTRSRLPASVDQPADWTHATSYADSQPETDPASSVGGLSECAR